MRQPVLKVEDLSVHFRIDASERLFRHDYRTIKAVDRVSFELGPAETLGIVGESGCGKSTLARMLTLIETPTKGRLEIDGVDAAHAGRRQRRILRRAVQMVFQDPYGSLNPRKTVGTIVEEPLVINTRLSRAERRKHALYALELVGGEPRLTLRSGGSQHTCSGGRSLADGEWHHLVYRHSPNAGTSSIFIDGEEHGVGGLLSPVRQGLFVVPGGERDQPLGSERSLERPEATKVRQTLLRHEDLDRVLVVLDHGKEELGIGPGRRRRRQDGVDALVGAAVVAVPPVVLVARGHQTQGLAVVGAEGWSSWCCAGSSCGRCAG